MSRILPANIFSGDIPSELTDRLIRRYSDASEKYLFQDWDGASQAIGKVVEIAFRIVEYEVSGNFTPFDKALPKFDTVFLQKLESQNRGIADSWRCIIPRFLFAMYAIRNRRGIAHESEISPNYIDATELYYSMKWVLCEIIRLDSDKNIDEIENTIKAIETRRIDPIWSNGKVSRVLIEGLTCEEQVLVLLFVNHEETVDKLLLDTEYSQKSRFKNKILAGLHKKRLIEYDDPICTILPKGCKVAEGLILKSKEEE